MKCGDDFCVTARFPIDSIDDIMVIVVQALIVGYCAGMLPSTFHSEPADGVHGSSS